MSARGSLRMIGRSTSSRPLQHRFATSAPPRDLRKRAVVGSFLFRRHDDGTLRVALFKRSDKVNTYRHKYGAISGGVEPEDASPLKAALRELYEETSLTSDSLQYLSTGRPYSFVDDSVNYEWSVHPFAFHWPSGGEEPLTLGWEHDGHAWFQPHQVPEDDVAAGVIESLRRVWPEGELGRAEVLCRYCLGEAVGETTRADARRDTADAFAVFCGTVRQLTSSDADAWWRLVRLAAWHVWNHADPSIKGPLLTRLLPGLELVEQLLEPQRSELAPQFEKLAAMALENVAVEHMDNWAVAVDGNVRYLTQEADRFFSGLWATS